MCLWPLIPSYELKTSDSRGVLPSDLSYKEAVAASSTNVAIAALLQAIWLRRDMLFRDMFHERYRQNWSRNLRLLRNCQVNTSAYATYLSGAGPTVMTLTPK